MSSPPATILTISITDDPHIRVSLNQKRLAAHLGGVSGRWYNGIMVLITVEQAEGQLADLLTRASGGEDFIIVRGDAPLARLSHISPEDFVTATSAPRRWPGNARDEVLYVADDFDAPLEDFQEYM
ncbi:MAG: type II toxin-antitoxin system Phd/YefM family antitoxin [Capsulimonadaceae bacterium]